MEIFWSYARLDDQPPHEMVSNLRQAFETELSQAIGKECKISVDKLSLKWGLKWQTEIKRLISKSECFVALVTPSFFNSRMCIFELQMACEQGKKILPIYFRVCKELKSTFKENGVEAEFNKKLNEVSLSLDEIQRMEFYPHLYEDYASPAVRAFIGKMVNEII